MLALIGFVGLSELVGLASGGLTAPAGLAWFLALNAPPGTPPAWLFGPVWTVLYAVMGVAAWIVWQHLELVPVRRYTALRVWGWQLALNALWAPAFFGLRSPVLGLVVIIPLLVLVAITTRRFRQVRPLAGNLMLPYLAWVAFATYLNAGLWWLNRPSG